VGPVIESLKDVGVGLAEVRPAETLAGAGAIEVGGNKKAVLVKPLASLTHCTTTARLLRTAGHPERDQLR
jgi:hypothetical protein